MNTSHLVWLLHCADRLNPEQSYPVRLRRLLASLGIELRKEASKSGRISGVTRKKAPHEYEVVLMRPSDRPSPLTARERFTLAHELGHILLDVRLHWQPRTKEEYRLREDWCNRFAARLLVPPSVLKRVDLREPSDALQSAIAISRDCHVSLHMAARRVAEMGEGVVLFALEPADDPTSKRALRVKWSTQNIKELGIVRGKRLAPNGPWSVLADHLNSRSAISPATTTVQPWGSAAAVRLERAKAQPSLVSALFRAWAPRQNEELLVP